MGISSGRYIGESVWESCSLDEQQDFRDEGELSSSVLTELGQGCSNPPSPILHDIGLSSPVRICSCGHFNLAQRLQGRCREWEFD